MDICNHINCIEVYFRLQQHSTVMLLIRHTCVHLINDDCCRAAPALRSIRPRRHLDHGVQITRPPNACKASQLMEELDLQLLKSTRMGYSGPYRGNQARGGRHMVERAGPAKALRVVPPSTDAARPVDAVT